jgi:hypothetical protein
MVTHCTTPQTGLVNADIHASSKGVISKLIVGAALVIALSVVAIYFLQSRNAPDDRLVDKPKQSSDTSSV